MIEPAFCRTMARYNRWQNASLIKVADGLTEDALEADRGTFFGSIRRTFSHLLWGDVVWMSRFDGWDAPDCGLRDSPHWRTDWAVLKSQRSESDEKIIAWADGLGVDALLGDLSWYSGALDQDVTRPLALCVTHFFNHQTHHRGQIHAMLTAAGTQPDDTDLFVMPEEA